MLFKLGDQLLAVVLGLLNDKRDLVSLSLTCKKLRDRIALRVAASCLSDAKSYNWVWDDTKVLRLKGQWNLSLDSITFAYDHRYAAGLLYLSAFEGSRETLEWVRSRAPTGYANAWKRLVRGAALGGQVDLLRGLAEELDLKSRSIPPDSIDDETDFLAAAARGGSLEAVEFLRAQKVSFRPGRYTLGYDAIVAAVNEGHLEIIKYLHREGCTKWTNGPLNVAARAGDISVLTWLLENTDCKFFKEGACIAAVGAGNLETLRWLRERGCPLEGSEAMEDACCFGHLHIAQYLRLEEKPPCDWSSKCCVYAASRGDLSLLKWLRSQRPPCPWEGRGEACRLAARNGHLEVLQFLRKEKCPWDVYTCAFAAGAGHLKILEWARKKAFAPWDQRTTNQASVNGQAEVLEWAVRQGCPFDADACAKYAKQNGHREVEELVERLVREQGSG